MVRKRKCPKCGARAGVPLIYGNVGGLDVIAQAERGEIVLGGSVVTGADPDWHCQACSHEWRARRSGAKKSPKPARLALTNAMLEGLREFGLPALRRMNAADDIAGRLAPMGVFRGWAEHFGLPRAAVDPGFELTCYWAEDPEAAERLDVPRTSLVTFERLNIHRGG